MGVNHLLLIILSAILSGCFGADSGSLSEELGGQLSSSSGNSNSGGSGSTSDGLIIVSGNFQLGSPGLELTDEMKVQLLSGGSPVAGATVGFSVSGGAGGSFTSNSATTDASGYATANFTPTIAGESKITATANGSSVEFTHTIVDQSGVSLSYLGGDGQSTAAGTDFAQQLTVRVTKTLDGSNASSIVVRFQTLTGNGTFASQSFRDVATDANGLASATFTAGTVSGAQTVRAFILANPAEDYTYTSLTGTVSAADLNLATSTITSTPDSVQADGSSTTSITFTARDAYGNQVPATGATVVFSATQGSVAGPVDNGDGSYTATYTAPLGLSTNTSIITGTYNSTAIGVSETINLTPAGVDISTLYSSVEIVGGTSKVAADGTTEVTVRVTLRNSSNVQNTSGGATVAITPSTGTMVGAVLDNNNGTYDQNWRAPSSAAAGATATVVAESKTLLNYATMDFYGAIDVGQSLLTAIPTSIQSGGAETSIVVLTARDANGTTIPAGGSSITFSTTNGNFGGPTSIAATDLANGQYTATLTSAATDGSATVSATLGATPFTATETITFYTASNLAGTTIDCSNIATYQNGSIYVNGGTLTMNTHGSAGSCAASFTFTSIVLESAGIITHSAIGTGTDNFGIELTANSISIDGTSGILANGVGPSQATIDFFRGPLLTNIAPTGGANCYAGGTHGGVGMPYDRSGTYYWMQDTYGNITQPFLAGASGCNGGSAVGLAGGGRLKLTVSGTLTNNGVIAANGADGASGYSGAGGSVWINAATLAGTGTITARGGDQSNGYPGGGGGRIALYYTNASGNFTLPTNIVSNVTARGGNSTTAASRGGAGTVYLKDSGDTYGSLIIDNDSLGATYGNTKLYSPAAANPDIVSSTTFTKTSNFLGAQSETGAFVNYFLNPNTNQNASTKLSDDVWFQISSHDANTLTTAGDHTTTSASTGNPGRIGLVVKNLEITGGAIVDGDMPVIAREGDLQSNNTTTASVTGTIGSGVEYTTGATTVNSTGVTFTYSDFGFDEFSSEMIFQNGTFNFTNELKGSNITFTNSTVTMGDKITAANVTLDNTSMTITSARGTDAMTLTGTYTMSNSSTLTQATTGSNGVTEYSVEITADSFDIQAGSSITAKGKGYLSGTNYQCRVAGNVLSNLERDGGTIPVIGGTYVIGASHGGTPDYYNISPGNEVYGSFSNPYWSGASCRMSDWGGTATGGGIIRLVGATTGTMNIDGSLDVGGQDGPYSGAAGGSIYIYGGALSGGGSLVAVGSSGAGYAAGGGGRIGIHYKSLAGFNPESQANASGGNIANNAGGAGSVFWKDLDEDTGTLMYDNKGFAQTSPGSYGLSYVYAPARGASSGLSATQISIADPGTEFGASTNFLEGMWVNPDVDQSAPYRLSAHSIYPVISQSGNVLTARGTDDMTTVATTGETYQFVLNLKKLIVKDGAYADLSNLYLRAEDIELSGGSTHLRVPNRLRDIGIYASNNVSISGGASLIGTRTVTSGGQEYSIEMEVGGNLTIGASSSIDVQGHGYYMVGTAGCVTVGNQVVTTPIAGSAWTTSDGFYNGASHGGRGGYYNRYPNEVYGSFYNPYTMGSSCRNNSIRYPHYGGGLARIEVTGNTVLNGVINASAASGQAYNGAAGGGVFLQTTDLSGSGYIEANGGEVITANSAAGGGGRVAVHSNTLTGFSPATQLRAYGGINAAQERFTGAAGTVYYRDRDETLGTLIINNNGRNPGSTYSLIHTPLNLPANESVTGLSTGTQTYTTSYSFTEEGQSTAYPLGWFVNVDPTTNNDNNLSNDVAYEITGVSGTTITLSGVPSSVDAGSNVQYQLHLKNLEVAGGGDLRLSDYTHVYIAEGDYSSNDTTTLALQGRFYAGHGSSSILDLAGVTAFSLTNGADFGTRSLSVTGGLALDASTFTSYSTLGNTGLTVSGALSLANGSNLTHPVGSATADDPTPTLEVSAGSLSIDATSTVNVNAKGNQLPYGSIGCRIQDNRYTLNAHSGNNYTNSASYYRAASYGGRGGGNSTSFPSNEVYGSFYNPIYPGASCSGYTLWTPGAAGGVARFNISGNCVVNGNITADGQDSLVANPSGGSIYLNCADLSGSGALQAEGGSQSASYAGGGGGRIAIFYDTLSGGFDPSSQATAYGGQGASTYSGAAGTVYFRDKQDTYGTLVVKNNNLSTVSTTYTPIIVPAGTQSASSISTGSTAVTMGSSFLQETRNTQYLVGLFLDTDTTQNSTATLMDDSLVEVVGQSSGSGITLVSNPANASAANTAFVLALKNLELGAGAQIVTDATILVREGDYSSGDTSSLVIDAGELEVSTSSGGLEFNGLSTLTVRNGADVDFGTPISVAGNVTVDGATLSSQVATGNTAITSTGTVAVQNGGTLTHEAAGTNALDPVYTLQVSAASIDVDATSSINGDSKGLYLPYGQMGCRILNNVNATDGFNGRPYINNASNPLSGSHGGRGAYTSSTYTPNEVYGSFANPTYPGASCSAYTIWGRGVSGGVVRLTASGACIFNGTVSASSTTAGPTIGNAGGSVYINCGDVSGTGTISANGGDGGFSGGGGGRVALYYDTLSGTPTFNPFSQLQAFGGDYAAGARDGAAGTVYVRNKASTYGSLVVKNFSSAADAVPEVVTPIKVPSGTVTASSLSTGSTGVTLATNYNENTSVFSGYLQGLMYDTDTGTAGGVGLSDNSIVEISSHTSAGTLVLTANPASADSSNTEFYLGLEQLEVGNGGDLLIMDVDSGGARTGATNYGKVFITNGDSTAADTTLRVTGNGSIIAAEVDVDGNDVTCSGGGAITGETNVGTNTGC